MLTSAELGSPKPIRAFLSCSVRPRDKPLVDAVVNALRPIGIECYTIGRNSGSPDQVDDAIVRLMKQCDCLIGVASTRFDATDVDDPSRPLKLATSYLVGEGAMAHFAGMPWVVFKTPEVHLQANTGRNLYIEIQPTVRHGGKMVICTPKAVVDTTLRELKERAIARRAAISEASWRDTVTKGVAVVASTLVGGWALAKVAESATRPECFGEFYYRTPECKPCQYRADCKVEKARNARY